MGATDQGALEAPEGKRQSHWQFAVRSLTPLVRVLLRFGFSCNEMTSIIRKIAVDAALEHEEFRTRPKPFVAQAAVRTGLSRKEVTRLRAHDAVHEVLDTKHGNHATRVLDGWTNDPRYRGPDGKPLPDLPLKASSGVSFYQLAHEYGGDVPPRAILAALLEYRVVEESGDRVRLLSTHYVPAEGSDELADIHGICVHDMLALAEWNLRQGQEQPRLLREWFQRYVPEERIPEAEARLREMAMEFGYAADAELARLAHKQPLKNVRYRRIGIGTYYIESGSREGET
jgi:hypothetical protein